MSALTTSIVMASRCILGSQATGLGPCGWFPQGSLSEVWWSLCDIVIAFVGVCLDDIKSDGIKVHFGFPGNWFATLRVIATRIAKRSVKGFFLYNYFYRFCWCLLWRCEEWWRQGDWLSTSWVIPTKITRGSVMGHLLYFYRCGWCLPWRHPDWRRPGAFSMLENRFATDDNGCEWHCRVHCCV